MYNEAFASDLTALKGALQDVLFARDLLPPTLLGVDIHRLLQAPGKLLSSHSSRHPTGFWALLPLATARYCTPSAKNTLLIRLALCCELLHCALDCFDEIEDDDSSEERDALGDGRFLNAATALYTLALSLLDDVCPHFISFEQRNGLQHLLLAELLSAMKGQHLDLLAERADLASFLPEECLKIVAAKSGGLFRLVCRISAQAVNAPDTVTQRFADIGELMGIVAQLENDVHGLEVEIQVSAGETPRKSDIRRNKKTLPLVFAQKHLTALQQSVPPVDTEEQREQGTTMQAVAYKNAIIATLGAVAQLREQANALVGHIEHIQGKLPEQLCFLLRLDADYHSSVNT